MDQAGANDGRPGPEAQVAAVERLLQSCRECDLVAAKVGAAIDAGRGPEVPGHPAGGPMGDAG